MEYVGTIFFFTKPWTFGRTKSILASKPVIQNESGFE